MRIKTETQISGEAAILSADGRRRAGYVWIDVQFEKPATRGIVMCRFLFDRWNDAQGLLGQRCRLEFDTHCLTVECVDEMGKTAYFEVRRLPKIAGLSRRIAWAS